MDSDATSNVLYNIVHPLLNSTEDITDVAMYMLEDLIGYIGEDNLTEDLTGDDYGPFRNCIYEFISYIREEIQRPLSNRIVFMHKDELMSEFGILYAKITDVETDAGSSRMDIRVLIEIGDV